MTTTYTYDSRIVSDLHKEVYGCRPTQAWMQAWNANSEDAKQMTEQELLDYALSSYLEDIYTLGKYGELNQAVKVELN